MNKVYLDIEKIKKQERLTLPQLAEKVGIYKGNLYRMANGASVNLSTVNKIMKALNIDDINEVLSRKEES
ncbi:transcriptional regulator [Bacillus pseudomycoides]|uniref:helix-turn-helix domain-containing protein n=1 Tax=Bacillus pseudomycoides TaxID=64104 RepID=UPI000BEBFC5A|nr:helix-turn-helix transcriptional regulator [Bacillus pseudomycoides]PDZ11429.1 transcriptional regulator [Bacillus pseudomycoides]